MEQLFFFRNGDETNGLRDVERRSVVVRVCELQPSLRDHASATFE